MHISEQAARTPELIQTLTEVWARSIRVTHLFLSEPEIMEIRRCVPSALEQVAHLLTAQDGSGAFVGFMGIENGTLEMLFLDPAVRGKGLGRQMLRLGMEHYGVTNLTVNEQNPQAVGFYEHLGFHTWKRTEKDEQGGNYPLLYMRL